MLYDIAIIALGVIGATGAIWASIKIDRAVKDGKVRYIGKVRIEPKRDSRLDS